MAIFAIVALLIACGCEPDPKEASATNFQKVIGAVLARSPRTLEYPKDDAVSVGMKRMTYLKGSGETRELASALAEAGVLRLKEKTPHEDFYDLNPSIREPWLQSYARDWTYQPCTEGCFSLTLATSDPGSLEVVRFTNPSNFGPATVTKVTYRFRWTPTTVMIDPRYLKIRQLLERTTEFALLDRPVETSIELALYSDGWRAE